MAKDDTQLAEMTADDGPGWLSNVLADDETWSAGTLWKLGSWASAAIGSMVLAFFASHALEGARHDHIAAAELMRQAQQIQWVAKEGQSETRRLSSAVDTLNGDRDRLYARVTVLEQGLESVTGSVARHNPPASLVLSAASQPLNLLPPAVVPAPAQPSLPAAAERVSSTPADSAPETTAAQPRPHEQLAATTIYAPPDPGAPKLIEANSDAGPTPSPPAAKTAEAAEPKPEKPAAAEVQAAAPPVGTSPPASVTGTTATAAQEVAVSRTEFGVDLGAASSVDGLRALWRGLLKSDAAQLAPLRPLMAIRERSNGFGMQLRLVAGPLNDAAAAARICAALGENHRPCETTVFDGQRLAMKAEAPKSEANPAERSDEQRAGSKPAHRTAKPKRTSRREEPPPAPQADPQAPAQPEPQASQFSGLTSIFHR